MAVEVLAAGLPAPVRGGFTTRAGGVSVPPWDALNLGMHVEDDGDRVTANRDLAADAMGLRRGSLVYARQVHGREVRVVERASSRGRDRGVRGVDALVTTTPGLALAILAADCLPVLLADPAAGVAAAAHVGRAGLALDILAGTVEAMAGLGAEPGRITASCGPAICGRCYELPEQLAGEIERAAPGSRSMTHAGTPSIDLTAGATAQLRALGVRHVRTVGGCTLEQPERFFSYRRDGRTGRHGGLVVLAA